MRRRRPRADDDPRDRAPLHRFRQTDGAGGSSAHELFDQRTLLGIELLQLHLVWSDHHGLRPAGGVAGNVELHPRRHDDCGPRVGGCGEVEHEGQGAAGPALVGNHQGVRPHGRLDEPPPLLEFGRPAGEALGGPPHRWGRRPGRGDRRGRVVTTCFVRLVGGGRIVRPGLWNVFGDDVERDRRLIVDAGE